MPTAAAETGHEGLTTEGLPLPPLPMTSREARARGLKTFPSLALCRLDGTRERTTARGLCVACLVREKAAREARDLAMLAKGRQEGKALALRELEAEQRRQQQEAERAQQAAEKAAAREAAMAETEAGRKAQEKQRQQQREDAEAAAIRGRREAAAERFHERQRRQREAQAAAPAGEALPPWPEMADSADTDHEAAPWD
ncbi:hypothetical protein [Azohydromonas caseinilytica]|uniref:Uncharacterized protein n=1 Tax=Azohydromonas caseinilytica TaxID=2728836 RepID=A0A848FCA2_9BURK|nr:hypothetical protein [Azohydromonas caseinilytica]NML15591.1 hypothetical protein [Azohydromonas caseinilytica]